MLRPDPPFDIENRRGIAGVLDLGEAEARRAGRAHQTFEPIEPRWQAIREWIPDDDAKPGGDLFDQRTDSGKRVEIRREDGSILVLDSD